MHVDGRLAAMLVLDWTDPIWDTSDESAGHLHGPRQPVSGIEEMCRWGALSGGA